MISLKPIHVLRIGDFYEAFGPDADTLSRLMNITLSCKHDRMGRAVSLSGFPAKEVDWRRCSLMSRGYDLHALDIAGI